tara:strand:+ start:778 stop:948 length:171 start_codon:yes stop_codon:yes gene_type:complete
MIDAPTPKKPLPQIWIENNQFIIESASFRYCINTENEKVLFKLCRKMSTETTASTY